MKERDDWVRAENARTQRLIDASNAARAAKRGERKELLSRLTDPHRPKATQTGTSGEATRRYLPKLQEKEKKLLNEHEGCTRCCRFYVDHQTKNCPMTAANTWPDVETYVPLTLEMALVSKPQSGASSSRLPAATAISLHREDRDNETDSYVDPSPLTVPHLVATLDAFGPNISKFPLSVSALLDIGCPSVVINSDLANKLGLRRYPLPSEEDNKHKNKYSVLSQHLSTATRAVGYSPPHYVDKESRCILHHFRPRSPVKT